MSESIVLSENSDYRFDLDKEVSAISDALQDLKLDQSIKRDIDDGNRFSDNVIEGSNSCQLDVEDESATTLKKEDVNSDFLSSDDVKEPSELPNNGSANGDCCQNQENEDLKKSDVDNWIYILGHDQLKKRVIKTGDEGGVRPMKGQSVEIRCSGRLDDGTKVDEFDKLEMCIGEEEFLLAFDLCIPLMHIGEVCELVTESRFAYGKHGRKPDIPPDSKLTYEIELLYVKERVPYSELTIDDRLLLGNKKRLKGNSYYEAGEYSKSISEYMRALKVVEEKSEGREENFDTFVEIRAKCYNNMAAAQMHIEAWEAANFSCDEALKLQPDNVKALFRKGKCLANKGDVNAALVHLRAAAKISPEKLILREITSLEEKNKKENDVERALYQKMLGFNQNKIQENNKKKSDWWRLYLAGAVVAVVISMSFITFRYSGE